MKGVKMKCGKCAPPGGTLPRCRSERRRWILDPNLVSDAKIEIGFGAF